MSKYGFAGISTHSFKYDYMQLRITWKRFGKENISTLLSLADVNHMLLDKKVLFITLSAMQKYCQNRSDCNI